MTRVKRDTTAARWAAVSSGGLNEGPLGRAFVLFSLWFAVAAVASVGQVDVFGEIAKVTAVDGSEKDVFGVAIALDGEQLFVGARQDIFGTGATYVYELDEDLGWTLATKLTAPDEATGNLFGEALSADGDRIAIGASMDAAPFPGQGSAYIFERSGGTWHPAAKLEVDGFGFQFFGISISLEGDRLAAGASNDNILGITSGSVYLFERSPSGAWEQVDKIFGSDTESGDQFGSALALDGDQFAVSAITDDDQGSNSGSVYIFERSADGDWLEVEKVTAPDGGDFDQFGNAVALDADRLMVGVTSDDEFGVNSGAVHVYHRNIDGSWDWVQKLTALDAQERSEFGTSLALDGDRLAVGSAAFLAADAPGAAYIFEPMEMEDGCRSSGWLLSIERRTTVSGSRSPSRGPGSRLEYATTMTWVTSRDLPTSSKGSSSRLNWSFRASVPVR